MSNVSVVTEMFGAFYIQVNGVTSAPFATESDAEMARASAAGAAESTAIATAYTEYKGLADKNAKGKINVIVDFLTWVDAGSPAPEEVAEKTGFELSGMLEEDAISDAVTGEAVETVADLDEGDDESWMNA